MQQRHRYILKRLGLTAIALFSVATILFLMFRLLPGSPATAVFHSGMTEAQRAAIRAQFMLDEPLYIQYFAYLEQLAQGNLGMSFRYQSPVSTILIDRTLNTLVFMLPAVIISFTVGPVLGAYLAWHRGDTQDSVGIFLVLLFRGMPAFWVGMIALMIFSFNLGWFPIGGMRSVTQESGGLIARYLTVDFLWHLAIPLTVTTLYFLSLPTFLMRNTMLDTLGSDFIQLSRAQGLSEWTILYRHAARNSLLPVLHYAAVAVAAAFGGSVVIEQVFSWPGLGKTIWTAVQDQDYPLAQGAFLMLAAIVMVMNLLADVLSVYVDPRASMEE
jgi:peptide/nickel transport system permease protein